MSWFLDVGEFQSRFRPLSDAEKLLAGDYIEAVGNWILERKPDAASNDPGAVLVTVEVTREALLWGKYNGLSSFDEETSHSKLSGTLQFREIERFITARHRQILGLTATTGARGYFPVCDY